MGAVVHHGGQGVHVGAVADLTQDVLAHDDEGDAGGADVLLGAAIDEAVLGHIDGTAHDVRAHVSDEHDVVALFGGEVLADFGAVDGVVGGNVEVVGVSGDGPTFRDVVVGFVFGGGDDFGFAEILGFLGGLLGPDAGLEVGGLGLH